jgi:hypothetical protein
MARCSTTSICRKTTLALLDLALDAATVRSLTNRRQNRTHHVDETQTHVLGSELERCLDNVVTVRVAHELLEVLDVDEKFCDHHGLGWHLGAANALLDDVRAELLPGKLHDLTPKALAHGRSELGVVQIEDVLDDIVAEGVLDKIEAVRGNLANKVYLLIAGRMVDAALKNTAAVAMSTDNDAVFTHSIKDELCLGGFEVVQALLDDVVAIEVLDEIDYLAGQSSNDHVGLDTC